MDVEKTIEFLIGTAAQHDQRLAALETNMLTLTQVVRTLSESMIEMHTQMAELREEMRRRDAESRERDKVLDARISKLVSAIGALGRVNPDQP